MTITDLQLSGMTCSSCAARIERGLNRLDGVAATVNFAVEQAHVEHDPLVGTDELIRAIEATGYHASVLDHGHPGDHLSHDVPEERLRPRLIASSILAVPVAASSMVPGWQFPGWQWLVLALATPIVFWGGYPFHSAALNSARHGTSTMDTLVSIGTLAAYLWSAFVVITGSTGHGHGHVYFEVAAAVTVFLLVGRVAEAKAKRSAGSALRALLSLGAKEATVVRDGAEVRIPAGELAVGDVIVVRPGERVATDGTVIEGSSALDTSAMTGESVPVDVRVGDSVLGGAVNTYGRIVLRANKVGGETQLARMAAMVADAQSGKASIQRLADRVSAVFVPVVLVIAAVTLAGWLMTGHSVTAAFTAAVAVLIIACPCALGLATPTAILVGTGRGAQLGVLIKTPQVLEMAGGIDTVVLDKTGTVTTGRMTLGAIEVARGEDPDVVLGRAAAVEAASEHPVAAAIVGAARARGLAVAPVTDFVNDPGTGVSGVVDGTIVTVARAADSDGRTSVVVGWGGLERGVIRLADAIKPTSAEAIAELKAMGITPMLLTGDNAAVAARVAAEVGIAAADVIAGVLPSEKAATISALQARGRRVAMVGDGVNDAPSLAAADVAVGMGGRGSDAALESSDLVLTDDRIGRLVDAIELSRSARMAIRFNVLISVGAALGMAAYVIFRGAPLPLAVSVHEGSTIVVCLNGLRLLAHRPRR